MCLSGYETKILKHTIFLKINMEGYEILNIFMGSFQTKQNNPEVYQEK